MSFSDNEKIYSLQNLYSINPIAKSEKFKSILLKNSNVCIYPLQIETAIQMYESDTDFKELNNALTLSDYQEVKSYLPTFPFQTFLKQFEKSFYSVKEYCDLKNFIVFPLHIEFYDNYKGKIKFAGHHASLAIFQKDKDMIYIIDSDNIQNKDKDVKYNEKDYEKYLCKKVKYCIEKIMDKKCKIKFLDLRTPQSITKDDYCIFWSMALTNELFIEEKFNPEKTMNRFTNTYKAKKDLEEYIQNFISNL